MKGGGSGCSLTPFDRVESALVAVERWAYWVERDVANGDVRGVDESHRCLKGSVARLGERIDTFNATRARVA